MRRLALQTNLVFVLLIAGTLVLAPAFAAQPTWAGGGKDEKDEQKGNREKQKSEKGDGDKRSSRDASTVSRGEYFGDQHRVVVQNYYHEQFRTGRCPPGLAKKGNGCMPPGQAKRMYSVGQRYNRNFGNLWTYNQIPDYLRNQYTFDPNDRYYYGNGYLYQVDPRTLLVQQVISALLR